MTFSRRTGARFNRGRIATRAGAGGGGGDVTVVLPGTWSGYWDADSLEAGPTVWPSEDGSIDGVIVGSSTLLTDWLSSGRKALDFNGASQYVTADAFAALIAGADLPFSVAVQYSLDATSLETLVSASVLSGTGIFRRLIHTDVSTLRFQTTSGGSVNSDAAFAASTATEYVLTMSFTGTVVTTTINGATVHNAAAHDANAVSSDGFTLGATRRSDLVALLDGQVRRFAFRTAPLSEGDVTDLQSWLGT